MRIMFSWRVLGCIFLWVTALALSACSSHKTKPEDPAVEVGVGSAAATNEEHINRNQPDVRMAAVWEDGSVHVQIQNRTTKRLEVGPANFALIVPTSKTGGTRSLIPVEPGKVVLDFPVTQLDPKGLASGRFRFRELGNLEGFNLVFKSDDKSVRPSVCRIEAKKAGVSDEAKAPTDAPADAAAKE